MRLSCYLKRTSAQLTPIGWYTTWLILSVFGVIMSTAVIAFAPGIIGADLHVGVLFLVALGSLGILSALMAGWSSNNKYALWLSDRSVAEL